MRKLSYISRVYVMVVGHINDMAKIRKSNGIRSVSYIYPVLLICVVNNENKGEFMI